MKNIELNTDLVIKILVAFCICWIFIELFEPVRFHFPPHLQRLTLGILFTALGVYYLIHVKEGKRHDEPNRISIRPFATQITEKIGRLSEFTTNHMGDVDGIKIESNVGPMLFHFPPHAAKAVMQVGVVGDSMKIGTDEKPTPLPHRGRGHLISISNLHTNQSLQLDSIAPPLRNLPGEEITVTGSTFVLSRDGAGRIRGIIIDKNMIDLKPHESDKITPLLNDAHKISVTGIAREMNSGFVNHEGFRVIRPLRIMINETTYLIQ